MVKTSTHEPIRGSSEAFEACSLREVLIWEDAIQSDSTAEKCDSRALPQDCHSPEEPSIHLCAEQWGPRVGKVVRERWPLKRILF